MKIATLNIDWAGKAKSKKHYLKIEQFLDKQEFMINEETTESLKKLFQDLNLKNVTENIKENIDHIIIPKEFEKRISNFGVFVEKNVLSDHKGVFIQVLS